MACLHYSSSRVVRGTRRVLSKYVIHRCAGSSWCPSFPRLERWIDKRRMQDLPDECWALVLSLLKSKADRDAAALTCRRWRSLEALSRHSLHFHEELNLPRDQWPRLHLFLLQTLHSFPNIFSITIQGGFSDVHNTFPRVFLHKGFAQLTFLDLSFSSIHMNDHLVQCLAVNCPSLIHLSFGASKISDAGMYSLAHGCPLLQFLDMSMCSITDKGIDVLLSKCVDMRQFLVAECIIKGWGFRHGKCLEKIKVRDGDISSAGLAEGLQGATSLRALSLPHIRWEPRLSSIWECCKGLEVLNLTWSSSLNDVFLGKIVKSCKNLRVLILSHGSRVTLDGWKAVALSGRQLEKLGVDGCREFCSQSLLTIAQGCPNLRVLRLSDAFAFDTALAQFRVSRPAVEIKLYEEYDFYSTD